MQIIAMIIIIIVNLILQGSVVPFLDILVYLPNPALASIVLISMFRGKYYGAFFGLFMGLFQDMLYGNVIGIHALIFFIIGYTVGLVQASLNNENIIILVIFSAISTIVCNMMYFIIMYFMGNDISFYTMVKEIFSIEILYNGIITAIFYKLFFKLFHSNALKFGR